MDRGRYSSVFIEASQCLEQFKTICRTLKSADLGRLSNKEEDHLGLSTEQLEDALSRFNVWAGNIGALQRGKSSLDHRVAHADIRLEVLRLLKQLQSSLDELCQIVSGEREQQTWYSTDAATSFENSSDDDSFNDDWDDDTPPGGEAQEGEHSTFDPTVEVVAESGQYYLSICETLTSLFKLSIFIRKSTRGNKFAKSSAERKYEIQPDILHVRDSFPFASHNPGLIERLGRANAQRRQWLSYKKRHRDKLSIPANSVMESGSCLPQFVSKSKSVMPDLENDDAERSAFSQSGALKSPITELSSTEASTFYDQSQNKLNIEENSNAEFSETSYSESRLSSSDERTIYVPQPPPESEGENPFECPYCFTILTIANQTAWTKHVHSDLASYVCTQESCSHPLFESRHEWFNHELEVHRQEWICILCLKKSSSAAESEQHMHRQHSGSFLPSQLAALTAQVARPVRHILASSCPLCDYDAVIRRRRGITGENSPSLEPITVRPQTFRAHLGRHLEQLALFVLPRSELMKLPDAFVQSMAVLDTDHLPSKRPAISDNSESEGNYLNLTPDSEIQNASDNGDTIYTDWGEQQTAERSVLESDEILEELAEAPELAMGWLPPMNFTPPKEDFEVEDVDWIPRREESMFGGDLFTPGWVRGFGKDKEGFCGRCEPGIWQNMDDFTYQNDLTYRHGIDSSGIPLPRPSSIREMEGRPRIWEGYCEACQGWRNLRATKMGWNWFRHCIKEHNANAEKLTQPNQEANFKPPSQFGLIVEDLITSIRMVDINSILSILQRQPGLVFDYDSHLRTPIHHAAEVGDFKVANLLFNNGLEFSSPRKVTELLNKKSSTGETALMLAASQGNEDVTRALIQYGANVNALCHNGQTTLDRAAEAGFQKIVEILLLHEANVEKSQVYWRIKLRRRLLAQKEAVAMKKKNLKSEEVEKTGNEEQGRMPLQIAAMNGDMDKTKSLLASGVDIEALSKHGETALMLGASKGNHNVIKLLLHCGANINATNAKGWTTLMLAVRDNNDKTAELLITNGADVNHLSPDRWTALAEATLQSQTSMIALLLKRGADTESKSSHDWTPLMHAAYKGDKEAVQLLLEYGAELDVSSLHDETAILLAAAGSHTEIVRILLQAGCAPEPAWAATVKTSSEGKETIGEVGYETGSADPRAVPLGWTPLMLACQNGLEDVVRMLLEANVNLEPQSPYRKTALDIAKENGRLEIAKLLDELHIVDV